MTTTELVATLEELERRFRECAITNRTLGLSDGKWVMVADLIALLRRAKVVEHAHEPLPVDVVPVAAIESRLSNIEDRVREGIASLSAERDMLRAELDSLRQQKKRLEIDLRVAWNLVDEAKKQGNDPYCDVCGNSGADLRTPVEVCRDCYDVAKDGIEAVMRQSVEEAVAAEREACASQCETYARGIGAIHCEDRFARGLITAAQSLDRIIRSRSDKTTQDAGSRPVGTSAIGGAPADGDVLTRNSGHRASTMDVATATAAQGYGGGDGGERPALLVLVEECPNESSVRSLMWRIAIRSSDGLAFFSRSSYSTLERAEHFADQLRGMIASHVRTEVRRAREEMRDVVILLVEKRRMKVLNDKSDPSWTEHFAELENEICALAVAEGKT